MAALTADTTATIEREGAEFSFPAAASTQFYKGGLIGINASNLAVKMTAATGLKCVGVCQANVNNSAGIAGALQVPTRRGTFRFTNGESIVLSDIGAVAYANDDQTVYKTATGRSAVGTIVDVDASGVWVKI